MNLRLCNFSSLQVSGNQICTNPNAIRQLPGTCTTLHTPCSPWIKLPLTKSCCCSLSPGYDLNWIHVDISDTVKWREVEGGGEGTGAGARGKVRRERQCGNHRRRRRDKKKQIRKGVEPARDGDRRRGRGKRERVHV